MPSERPFRADHPPEKFAGDLPLYRRQGTIHSTEDSFIPKNKVSIYKMSALL